MMMSVDIWNEFDLPRPPLVTLKTKNAYFVEKFYSILNARMHRHRLSETDFKETAVLVGRIIARRKNSFRRMCGFREFCKLNAAIRRLERLDIQRDLQILQSSIPDAAFGEEHIAELPTRNCLDYVLVRLVTVHGLHERIEECCLRTAEYFVEMLRANNFLDISTLVLAVVAKLKKLSAILGNSSISLYKCLKEQRINFPHKGKDFLASDSSSLPSHLEKFQTLKPEIKQTEATTPDVNKALSEFVASTQSKNTTTKPIRPRKSKDMGVELERKSATNNQPKKSKEAPFNVDDISSIADIKNFMTEEDKSRKSNIKRCVTKNIQAHEWSGLQKLIERKTQTGDEKKALSIFKKFIGSKLS